MALAVTLVVLLFARDVGRSAHGAISPRRSENRSFSVLANELLGEENGFDARLAHLLTSDPGLSRPVFAARLVQLAQVLPSWQVQAIQLRRPHLAHDINDVLSLLTEQRVDDDQRLLAGVASSLSFPWPALTGTAATLSPDGAQASLLATSKQWAVARWGLVREPGHVTLLATTNDVARLDYATALGTLSNSSSLVLVRGIGILAVSVSPAPLPAPAGELLLPPTGAVRLGVTVSNASYADQPVSLTYVLRPTNRLGLAQRQTMTATLGPLQSYAFVPAPIIAVASERATLTISLGGASSGPGMSRLRRYSVIVSPSGNG